MSKLTMRRHYKAELFAGLDRFLSAATPHGLFYLQTKYKPLARIFWVRNTAPENFCGLLSTQI
jgi:hypothetical protein